jgi:hypothetical protein
LKVLRKKFPSPLRVETSPRRGDSKRQVPTLTTKERRTNQVSREWLNEAEIQLMQIETLKEYDRDVATPRHEEVIESVGQVAGKVDALEGKADRLEGAINAGTKFVAIPSAILAMLGIAKGIVGLIKMLH